MKIKQIFQFAVDIRYELWTQTTMKSRWNSMMAVDSSTIQAFQVMIPSFSDCHHHQRQPHQYHRFHRNVLYLFVTLPLNPINSHCSRTWFHLWTAIMSPIWMKTNVTMYRRPPRQRHRFHAIITVTDIVRPNGHRPTKIRLSTATKIAFYRLHATPIADWPLLNIFNRVAVGISHPLDSFPSTLPISPHQQHAFSQTHSFPTNRPNATTNSLYISFVHFWFLSHNSANQTVVRQCHSQISLDCWTNVLVNYHLLNHSIASQMNRRAATMISHGCATQKRNNVSRTRCNIRLPHCRQPWQIAAHTRTHPTKRNRSNRVNWWRDKAVWIDAVYWIAIGRSAIAKVVVHIRCRNHHRRPISPNRRRRRITCNTKVAEAMASSPINIRITHTNINVRRRHKYSGNDRTSRTGIPISVIAPIFTREVEKMFAC